MSSSQIIDGIIVMFTLNRIITPEVAAGIFVIGIMSGLALMLITIY